MKTSRLNCTKSMISHIRGNLEFKSQEEIHIDVSGIGYQIYIPLSTYTGLPDIGEEVKIHTYLHLREDAIRLFGFLTFDEKNIFELLINVTGVGPKIALAILSDVSAADFKDAIINENLSKLTNISGIGKKTAQRLVLELREKIGTVETKKVVSFADDQMINDAVSALVSLGYNPREAKKNVNSAIESLSGSYTLEEVIRKALTFF